MRTLTALAFTLLSFFVHAQQYKNVRLLSHWDNDNLPKIDGDQVWSDLMAWHDSLKQKEYIIAGGNDSLYFFDISNPEQIRLVDVEEGHSRYAINRDIETYLHYAYCVSDRTSPLGALQIFDLQYLPDSVHKVYDSDTLGIQTHTIFIEAASKRLYMCSNKQKGFGGINSMDIISIADPENPVLLNTLQPNGQTFNSNVHEMYARNDTGYLSCGNAGLYVVDLRDVNNQKMLGSITQYPRQGYNHSSWLDASGKKLLFTDENQGLEAKIYDISDLANPKQESIFNSNPGALPHNAYWKGNLAFVSAYEDGVVVFDISDTKNPKKIGWYDTYPLNAPGVYNGFHGCWGVWPYLPSDIIVASDISEGIFVLKFDSVTGVANSPLAQPMRIYPNPFINKIQIRNLPERASLALYSVTGKLLADLHADAENIIYFNEEIGEGIFFLKITAGDQRSMQKILKVR